MSLKHLKKLKGRSLEELRVRSAQKAAALGERVGWSASARLPNEAAMRRLLDESFGGGPGELLEHFRRRTAPRFFGGLADRGATLAELRRRFGGEAERLVTERAGRVAEGRFDLLGLRGLDFGRSVDWHLEPVAGGRGPLDHWSRIPELDAGAAGDKKIVWELNRHQHFATLGRAYWLTGDERFAETFAAHAGGWMEHNPPKRGVNWLSSLEVAFRAISWLWALHFFKHSPRLTPGLFAGMLRFLYLHARHLETFPSTYSSPNTHLTGEALGLYYLGTLLPEFRRARRWRAAGRKILLAELARQVRPDGVYFEQASYYHRYTADFYTHLLVLERANGAGVEEVLEAKLRALLDHLMHLTRPDGTTPFYGDDDGGRLMMLDERPADDFRAALSTGAALFGRGDYKFVASEAAEETLWLLGPEGLAAFDRIEECEPEGTSRVFPDGGVYVMRDGWGPVANYLMLDCGPHGALNFGHSHADALAFDLSAGGRTLLVDPGTYVYTSEPEVRDYFRTSAAHNTLTIDGESSSVPAGPFRWSHVAGAEARAWVSRGRFDYFEGAHDGYARLPAPATHGREVLFLKGDYWIVRDTVASSGEHRCDLHFHFAADAAPRVEAGGAIGFVRERGAAGLGLFTFGGGGGEWRAEAGWVSTCYAARRPAPVWVYSETGAGSREFVTFLVPRGAHQAEATVVEIEARGGRAFRLDEVGRGHDLLLVGGGELIEAAGIESNFRWAWLRLAEGGELEEFVLLGGRRLLAGGREVVGAAELVEHAAGRSEEGKLRVETFARGGGETYKLTPPGGGAESSALVQSGV